MAHKLTTSEVDVIQRLEQVEQDNLRIRAENARFHARFQTAQRRLRITTGLAFTALVGAIVVSPGSRTAFAQGYGITLQQLAGRLSAVEGKTQFMTADTNAKTTTFTACNVYVQNGLGATNGNPGDPHNPQVTFTNSLGNLIIGYNTLRGVGDQRGGSHNLVLGDFNNYTSYGGAVMGVENMISGDYATITGGFNNTASGITSSINGGDNNFANGLAAVVSGGFNITQNDAFGWSAGSLHVP